VSKKIAKPTLQQPDQSQIDAEEKRRAQAEYTAKGTIDGRKMKRSSRQEQINIKTSLEAKKKFDHLRVYMDEPFNVIFEKALDALEEKLGIKEE
jgi:GMP synthase PP-ATPase subunit